MFVYKKSSINRRNYDLCRLAIGKRETEMIPEIRNKVSKKFKPYLVDMVEDVIKQATKKRFTKTDKRKLLEIRYVRDLIATLNNKLYKTMGTEGVKNLIVSM